MFIYEDGLEILVGDSVLFENGRTSGTVEFIIATSEDMKAINVKEVGIMLKSPSFGHVYLPQWYLIKDPLRFLSRSRP